MKIVPTTYSKRLRWSLALTAALTGATVMAQLLIPAQWQLHCGFHSLTGLPCPGCGASRCGLLMIGGHWREAALLQPLFFAGAVVFLSFLPYAVPALLLNWPLPHIQLNNRKERVQFAATIIVLVLVNWTYLMLHHT